jgi:small subunit ribosomal protein S4
MAKNLESKCKLCRRAGEKLFLKGDRCASPKCAMIKKNYPPGIHGNSGGFSKVSEYGKQLAQKQKIKRIYGVSEKQFKKHFEDAQRQKGIVGDNLIIRLEMRFDNVIHRLGFAQSRTHARQLVGHSHFLVNGKKFNIPSACLKIDDVITIKPHKAKKNYFKELEAIKKKDQDTPKWILFDPSKMEGKIVAKPTKNEVGAKLDVQDVIEFYSR